MTRSNSTTRVVERKIHPRQLRFIRLPVELVEDDRLTHRDVRVALAVAVLYSTGPVALSDAGDIGDVARCTWREARNSITALLDNDWLVLYMPEDDIKGCVRPVWMKGVAR